ncbi:MAG: cobyrinic acid a,c-diamide synthase [Gammaproteobacteria bacterium]|nr:MAG: cobyrinic acid a,c-diamide synthase [Gammaproteobacteria bacterium]
MRLYLSATQKSSGKTTVTVGLCAALRRRGLKVQPFKKGPDYIDPLWLSRASGTDCHNLDFYTMEREEIRELFVHHAAPADVVLVEGNKGLHDGLSVDGSDSNAAMARHLDTPVVLVVDTRGMTRGVAPLVAGYAAFDPKVKVAGLILNQVGGPRHEAKLRRAIENYSDLPVLGALGRDDRLQLAERHLGLIPANEARDAEQFINRMADAVADQVDLDALLRSAQPTQSLPTIASSGGAPVRATDVRIGIARDRAFAFYYAGDLKALQCAGAELVPVDTLNDRHLPDVDGLFIGGGFPEACMDGLEANGSLRHDIRTAVENGLPVYAECGGLMYLTRSVHWQGQRREMVGAIPADAIMHARPQGRGYVRLRETGENPWCPGRRGELNGHEFHHSTLEDIGEGIGYAYEVLRGAGIDGRRDGLTFRNVLASYSHLRHTRSNPWADHFVDFVRRQRGAALPIAAAAT